MNPNRQLSPLLMAFVAVVLVITGLVAWNGARLLFRPAEDPVPAQKQRYAVERAPAWPTTSSSEPSSSVPDAANSPRGDAQPATAGDPLLAAIRGALHRSDAIPNEALLTFRTRGDLAQFLRQAAGYGLKLIGTIEGLNTVRIGFQDEKSLRDYLAAAGKNAPALSANNWMAVPRLPKNDGANQAGTTPVGDHFLQAINATGDRTHWGQGVTVAVLDTGVLEHPTFGKGQVTHLDLVQDGKPSHSHGTSVASLIAGQDELVPGVAQGASILDIRVADGKGVSASSTLAQGIVEAVNRGANVINISMGGDSDSGVLRDAVAYAAAKNVIIVAAAGNDHQDQLAYPAALPGVISIGSVDGQNLQAWFSNSGSSLSFAAPGVSLPTAWDTDKIASVSGTSQSTAVATGVIATYLSHGVSASQLMRTLQKNAKATGASQYQVGSGVVQIPNGW